MNMEESIAQKSSIIQCKRMKYYSVQKNKVRAKCKQFKRIKYHFVQTNKADAVFSANSEKE